MVPAFSGEAIVGGRVFTVGHSVLALDEFIAALGGQRIRALADVRRFPGSRRHPQFGAKALERSLARHGIAYAWFEDLGGRRDTKQLSADNAAWRVDAFHAYADWMRSTEFQAALARLGELARAQLTAVMCAEALWTRCHRRLIADALLARGWEVVHLLPPSRLESHHLPDFAQVTPEGVRYPPPLLR
jgi:uncharacterized protein (DUF488 family)